jgi:hypothetical protein
VRGWGGGRTSAIIAQDRGGLSLPVEPIDLTPQHRAVESGVVHDDPLPVQQRRQPLGQQRIVDDDQMLQRTLRSCAERTEYRAVR